MTYIVSSVASPAEYLEIYDYGGGAQNWSHGKDIDYAVYMTNVGGGDLVHNSISSDDAFLRTSAPSGINFHSRYNASHFDNLYFFKSSSSAKYLLEYDYIVKHNSSSTETWMQYLGTELSNNSSQSSSHFNTNPTGYILLHTVNDQLTIDNTLNLVEGKYQRLAGSYVFTCNNTSSEANLFGVNVFYGSEIQRLSGHGMGSVNLTTVYRHVKVTKIA